ncbi:hypothetical protein PQX77_018559 [Marasmius sp. AFHP31]|nr:hypothetical protein PQX77_018559 [Marasmius sp. AFHP31]
MLDALPAPEKGTKLSDQRRQFRPDSLSADKRPSTNQRNSVGGLVYATAGWGNGASAAEIQAQKDLLKQCIDILEGLEPGTASYINEGSL